MKFTATGIEYLEIMLGKMERYFAFKYEVPRESIAFVIKGKGIHILVNGKMKESIVPRTLEKLGVYEETGDLKGPKSEYLLKEPSTTNLANLGIKSSANDNKI